MKKRAVFSVGMFLAFSAWSMWASGPSPEDVHNALVNEQWAWNDHGPCTRFLLCATYFDSFGVNITFSDGSIVPFAHVQRLTTSAHDCVQNAKNALAQSPPNRGLAVEWVMASQIHNKPLMEWMRTHPDAVVAALAQIH